MNHTTMIVSLFILLTLGACTDDGKARKTLLDAGYKNIELTGHSWRTCSNDDDSCTGFTAIGPTGRYVEGAVGCGFWGKGCTIRFE